ncbi:hypothetical protein M5E88_05870 [Akkermansia muciniphila]|nr:hypothetical protein M5E88_05870 [Akkermansia muciniphila]
MSSTYPTDIKLESSWINYEDATIKMLRSAAITLKKRKKPTPLSNKHLLIKQLIY